MTSESAPAEPERSRLLIAEGVGKSYAGIPALADVTVEVRDREVLGVVGENGAGKSTLLNILSGVISPDTGRVLVQGNEVSLRSYRDANAHGIFRVFQELALVPNVPVYENLFLTHERHFSKFGVLNRSAMKRRASAFLEEFDHSWIDPTRETGSYSFSVRQILEIIKSFALAELLGTKSPVLLLDEPTAGLLADETEFFFKVVAQAKKKTGIVYVGHRLSELLELSDRVLVIKDGRTVGGGNAADLSEQELHQMMVGRTVSELLYHEDRQKQPTSDVPLLEVKGLSQPRAFQDVSLEVRPGEIVGVAGVIGSGKSELGRAIFGAQSDVRGDVLVSGKSLARRISSSTRAGIGYVPQDRAAEGALLPQAVSWNISLARISARGGGRAAALNIPRERKEATRFVDLLRVKTPGIQAAVGRLSGGNQQKVILARWLSAGSNVLILDNPTRGVDVGAKEQIYGVMRDLSDRGVAILLISDDLPELIQMSTRVLIMSGGSVKATIDTPAESKPSEVELVSHMV
jgi:ribose transport system ATP-binding protein